MPQAIIPLVIAAVGTAATVGTDIYSMVNKPGAPKPADTSAADALAKLKSDTGIKEAILNQAPSIQAQLGGSVSPDYYLQAASTQSGNAGETNLARQALQSFLGLGGETGESGTPGGSSVTSAFTPPSTLPFSTSGGGGTGSGQPGVFEGLLSQFMPPGVMGGQDLGASGGYQ